MTLSKKRFIYLLAALSFCLLSIALPACNDAATPEDPGPVEGTPPNDGEPPETPDEENPDEENPGEENPGEDTPPEEIPPTDDNDIERPTLKLEQVAVGLQSPVSISNPDDATDRLFIVGKGGVIQIVEDGNVSATPFLNVTELVSKGNEQGLLGLAFHPDYETNGLFYVNYTDTDGTTQIVRYEVSDDPNVADPSSAKFILSYEQPAANHNAGQLLFGPDGYLYIPTGDGGSQDNGQKLDTLLGKVLRIDVDSGDPYTVPESNPDLGAGARAEIWAYGLRNPWRSAFDRVTGDLYIADVGQNRREEVSFQAANSEGGENYGWKITEGELCYPSGDLPGEGTCDTEGLVEPIITYGFDGGQSITGGFVYRGEAIPGLVGDYLYADFLSGDIWAARRDGDTWTSEIVLNQGTVAGFGEDDAGELYVVSLGGGNMLKIVAE